MWTPWGKADSRTKFADGIVFYGTARHGGFHVDRALVSQIPKPLRGLSGYPETWYEEDCSWAAVAYAFPEAFLPHMRDMETAEQVKQHAIEVLQRWYPDEIREVIGT